ncbi:SMP-30/gluconolactonase/LRE family protein [Mycoplana rhizolycopersici]|uniref:SMP-30/gluconolactonase/LRE family protein n=1 Tax=Mycoplana rhizolycopersici TaxID=2746702 RepID=A0ABX2QC74_9HYPH|nr:SMP-30/gluconolactonase/LRE family protein [Rhizobium rhizolycopersici]NVP55332.1 SMP-30/gluconolactonase/LRE family protein [Rhizobium rhizolycopersici]
MTGTADYQVLGAEANRLGECPIWCERTARLWWVDVLTPTLWSYDPVTGECRRHPVSARRIGSIALRETGGLLLACDDGLFAYEPETGMQEFLCDPEPGKAGHRKNDGRADPAGNFWVGTLREEDYAPVGALYRVGTDRNAMVEAENLAIPNGLAFDPVRKRMYFCDTRAYEIWACDYDAETGRRGPARSFARTIAPARPDGSCIDADGYLWNAEYAGGRLLRFAPSGEVSMAIDLPVTYPTCCCFGGRDFDELYVTSAAEPLTDTDRAAQPLAGKVLVFKPGVSGRPECRVRF